VIKCGFSSMCDIGPIQTKIKLIIYRSPPPPLLNLSKLRSFGDKTRGWTTLIMRSFHTLRANTRRNRERETSHFDRTTEEPDNNSVRGLWFAVSALFTVLVPTSPDAFPFAPCRPTHSLEYPGYILQPVCR
jgi:hypothetical protein